MHNLQNTSENIFLFFIIIFKFFILVKFVIINIIQSIHQVWWSFIFVGFKKKSQNYTDIFMLSQIKSVHLGTKCPGETSCQFASYTWTGFTHLWCWIMFKTRVSNLSHSSGLHSDNWFLIQPNVFILHWEHNDVTHKVWILWF